MKNYIGGVGAVVQEVVHAADEPGVGRPGRIAAVGLVDVDGVGLGIADEGLCLLRDLNELIGSDDVLRIVQADQADRRQRRRYCRKRKMRRYHENLSRH